MAKLRSSIPVAEAARRHQAGESLRALSAEYGVTVHTLSRHLVRGGHPVRSRHDAVVAENLKRPQGKGSRGGRTAYSYVQELRQRKAAFIREWKETHGCQGCGEKRLAALDLHHPDRDSKHPRLRRKNASGSRRTGGYFWRDLSYEDLALELEKCIVLCSNCHRVLETEERS